MGNFVCTQKVRNIKSIKKHFQGTMCQGIPIVTLYSYLSILVGKISTVFWRNLEYLLTDQGQESPEQS